MMELIPSTNFGRKATRLEGDVTDGTVSITSAHQRLQPTQRRVFRAHRTAQEVGPFGAVVVSSREHSGWRLLNERKNEARPVSRGRNSGTVTAG